MGIPEGREWFFGDSAMAIDRAATGTTTTSERLRDGVATGRQQWTKGLVMGRRRGDENGREAIGEEKGECRF